jgi:hypothetical protein
MQMRFSAWVYFRPVNRLSLYIRARKKLHTGESRINKIIEITLQAAKGKQAVLFSDLI